jgi:hypothetical protein
VAGTTTKRVLKAVMLSGDYTSRRVIGLAVLRGRFSLGFVLVRYGQQRTHGSIKLAHVGVLQFFVCLFGLFLGSRFRVHEPTLAERPQVC